MKNTTKNWALGLSLLTLLTLSPNLLAQVDVTKRGIVPPRSIQNADASQSVGKFGQILGVKRYNGTDTLVGYLPIYYLGDSTLKIGAFTVITSGNLADSLDGAVAWADLTSAVQDSIGRIHSLSLLQDSILVAYDRQGAELFRDTIAGTGTGGSGDDVSAFPNGVTILPAEKLVSPDSLYTFQKLIDLMQDSIPSASDGDKGDIDVTGGGTVWTVDTAAVTWLKLAQPVIDSTTAHRTDITNLQTLTGRPDGSTHLGTFPNGTVVPDNVTIKVAIDSLDNNVTDLLAVSHAAVTLGTENGIDLSLSGQQLSAAANLSTDGTLTGIGTSGSPLKVDTSDIATLYDVNRQEVTAVAYNATTDILTLTKASGNLTASIPTDTIASSSIYTGTDSLSQATTVAKMAPTSGGTQVFALGSKAENTSPPGALEYGLYINSDSESSLYFNLAGVTTEISAQYNSALLFSRETSSNQTGQFNVAPGQIASNVYKGTFNASPQVYWTQKAQSDSLNFFGVTVNADPSSSTVDDRGFGLGRTPYAGTAGSFIGDGVDRFYIQQNAGSTGHSEKYDYFIVELPEGVTTGNNIHFYNKSYAFPNSTPSFTLGDTTIMAWRGTGSAATPLGFVKKSSDLSAANEGNLSLDSISTTKKWLKSNTSGDGGVILKEGSNINLYTSNDTLTISSTGGALADTTTYYYDVQDYGILPDGTDYSSEFQNLLDTAYAYGNGQIQFRAGTYRFDDNWTIPNDGDSGDPQQPALIIRGVGSSHDGQGGAPSGGTILDFHYSGSLPKIDTRGGGHLTIEKLTIKSSDASGGGALIKTTNTTLRVSDCMFYGGATGFSATEDGIQLGTKTASPVVGNGANAPFQGYGTVIEGNYFNRVETAVALFTYANGITVRDNTVWNGSGGNQAILVEGTASNSNTGGIIEGNLIEMGNYRYGIVLDTAINFTITGNNFYDTGDSVIANIYLKSASHHNYITTASSSSGAIPVKKDNTENNFIVSAVASDTSTFKGNLHFRNFDFKLFSTIGAKQYRTVDNDYWYPEMLGSNSFDFMFNDNGTSYSIANFKATSSTRRDINMSGSADNRLTSSAALRLHSTAGTELWLGDPSNQKYYVLDGILYGIGNASGNQAFRIGATGEISWSQTSGSPGAALDVGLSRNAAGKLRLTNGSSGLGNLYLNGIYDSTNSLGTSGYVLQSNGSAVVWTASTTGDDVSTFPNGVTITAAEKFVTPDSLYTIQKLIDLMQDSIGGGSGESTTVTDSGNGLDITETGDDITIAYDILELSNVAVAAADSLLIWDASADAYKRVNAGSIANLFTGVSGTTNYIAKFTSSTAVGNSLIQDDGSNVAINTSPSSSYMLDIAGRMRASATYTNTSSLPLITNSSNIAGITFIRGSASRWAQMTGYSDPQKMEFLYGTGTANPSTIVFVIDSAGHIKPGGGYMDTSGDLGTSGQILSSTGSATNWIDNVDNSITNEGNLSLDSISATKKWLKSNTSTDGGVVFKEGANINIYVSTDTITISASGGAADGNGIYSGSGTIASAAAATVTASSTFSLRYSNAQNALHIDDNVPAVYLFSRDANSSFMLQNSGVIVATSYGTGTTINALQLFGSQTDTPANGDGVSIALQMENSTNTNREFARIRAGIIDVTNASEDGELSFHTYTAGALTQKAVIDENGWLGVGSTDPVSLLDIMGGLTTTGAVMTFGTNEPTVVANDILGRLNFYAPMEADGSDAILVGASIAALAEGTFNTTTNTTSLIFQTGASETATTKMTLTSAGLLGVGVTAPDVKLHVIGTDNTNGQFRVGYDASNYLKINVVDDGDVTVTPTGGDFNIAASLILNSAGVRLTDDGDGAVTLLGLGNGFDEDLKLNFDDGVGGTNTIEVTSSTLATNIYFTGLDLNVPDEVYDATNWDGSTEVPTKNAIRDKIQSMGGGGDFVGPASSTDNAIVRFDGTTGKLGQNSGLLVDDSNNLTGPTAGFTITGGTATTADLTLQTTSGVGATGADFHLKVGNNGATEALTVLNNGRVGIGVTSPASIFEIQDGLTTTGAVLTLGTEEPTVVVSDVLGRVDFYAPLEADGSDAILVAASIVAVSEGTFNTTTNTTSLAFQTGASETATTKMTLTSGGSLGVGTTSPDRQFHVEVSDAVTNAISYSDRLSHITSGTATTSFGIGTEFELENGSGTNKTVAEETIKFSDATNASEDVTYSLGLMKAGTLTNAVTILSTGAMGLGNTTSPTALLHLAAGTTTLAPVKLTSGTSVSSPGGGELEFDGTNLFFSPSTTRHTVMKALTGSATLNFGSITNHGNAELTITVTGAEAGDEVILGIPSAAINTSIIYYAYVSATDTVTVRAINGLAASNIDPGSGTFKVSVIKR